MCDCRLDNTAMYVEMHQDTSTAFKKLQEVQLYYVTLKGQGDKETRKGKTLKGKKNYRKREGELREKERMNEGEKEKEKIIERV